MLYQFAILCLCIEKVATAVFIDRHIIKQNLPSLYLALSSFYHSK